MNNKTISTTIQALNPSIELEESLIKELSPQELALIIGGQTPPPTKPTSGIIIQGDVIQDPGD